MAKAARSNIKALEARSVDVRPLKSPNKDPKP